MHGVLDRVNPLKVGKEGGEMIRSQTQITVQNRSVSIRQEHRVQRVERREEMRVRRASEEEDIGTHHRCVVPSHYSVRNERWKLFRVVVEEEQVIWVIVHLVEWNGIHDARIIVLYPSVHNTRQYGLRQTVQRIQASPCCY